ncbi:protein ACTIVITY OF BC1 COMPLEX KINASE 8, chloroplastic-like isoform X1 [Nymphaea colorata]|nr:protein ACTIVITY OF BC1 COMPLEX KINASE 8, chloroplastic-like isoform X1 [Nymphaea colorata]XP_049931289.1 protein ACTIVITY OF BC1 COMPLEX KINASE 8, chloroplastic-like isoform X1 [Nymphaea colorata]XP_049931290.1 protein ACTIVITY OF BC1 COMPLEX KINASE 8, chloroplastic-like isoform X1 [Nymphaea colorata]XP_049931291.1 protein ACTIVITY OF BC1 COMPLEX KINASE 8, chloroplastic-like isoform X1 [Nymphaea colorata]XP_049931292.1 protein ACTIVITY OF BC1 COMPLEX KINASE 8, chloroplastic-like isoform X1 
MGWGNIYKRRMKVFTVALIIYLDYKALQKRERWIKKAKRAALWEIVHERNARRLLNLIIELEGLWVKLGQYLSTRADVLPQAYICLLKQLQDSMPSRPLEEVILSNCVQIQIFLVSCKMHYKEFKNGNKPTYLLYLQVRHTIEEELGQSMDDLFSDFDETPLATASIAQVHRAILRDGQEVVVKVQHEGIKAVILEDLKNAKAIVDWIAWAEPQYDFSPLIDEWCKEAPKELDFNREADNTKTVSKNLGCKSPSSGSVHRINVLIPEVIRSTEKLLILEFMDGVRLNDNESLEKLGIDKQRIVEEITRAYAHQIYVDGFFNGDPHPGNFLVSREPPHHPVLLDFGLTKSISSSTKQALAKMFLACAEGDHVALLSAFAEIGLRLRVDMPDQAMEITNIFFRNSTPADEYLENLKALAKDRNERMKAIQEKMKLGKKKSTFVNPVDAFPGDAVIFVRVLNLLRGLSAILNVRIVYLDILRPFAEAALLGNQMLNVTPEKWVYEKPVLSRVEAKLRQLLLEIGQNKILGIQVSKFCLHVSSGFQLYSL